MKTENFLLRLFRDGELETKQTSEEEEKHSFDGKTFPPRLHFP